MITAELLRPDALSASDLQAWAAFRSAEPAFCNPLLGPRWAQAVGRVRPDACVAVLKRDGATVGFLPHNRAARGLARPIGAPFSDIHALVSEPGQSLTLSQAVAAADLRCFRYSGLLDPAGQASGVTGRVNAHVVVQSGTDDLTELIRSRNPKRFKNWRRLASKLEREQGETSLLAHDSSPQAFRQLLHWKRSQLRRSGLHDVYRPVWVQQLMAALVSNPDPEFGGLLVTLSVGGRLVAGEFGVREDRCFHPWIAAYDPAFAAYSPGILLQLRIIETMSSLGLRRYDLGAMSDHYKAPMATHQLEVVSGAASGTLACPAGWSRALNKSRLAARLSQRWEQIAAVETSALGMVQGVFTAVRDGPKRLGADVGAG